MLQLAQPKDREAVNALALQVHSLHVGWRPDIYEMVEELYPRERFDDAVENRERYVAKLGTEVVGYVLVQIRNYDWPGVVRRRVMSLDEICVDEELRCNGIGSQMLEDVKALARAFGCSDIQLGVYPQNEAAIRCYEKAGFTVRNVNFQMKL